MHFIAAKLALGAARRTIPGEVWDAEHLVTPSSSTESEGTPSGSRDNRGNRLNAGCVLCDMTRPVVRTDGDEFPGDLAALRNGSVDTLRGTATAACRIPTLGVNLSDGLNYCSTFTKPEQRATRLAIQHFIQLPVP